MDQKLRKEAESLLSSKFNEDQLKDKPLAELIHELKVHQIELELQNDELIRTQEKLLASQQKYYELFDQAPVAYLMVDDNTRIRDVNHKASAILKQGKGLLENKKFESFIHPDFQDEFYFFFTGLRRNALQTVHESCLRIDNEKIFIRISCNVDQTKAQASNKLIRFTLFDITAEKLAQQELETIKERLELSLLAGNVAWWVWDYPSQTVFYDKKKAEMLGYTDGRMTQNLYEITSMIHPDDYERTMDNMRSHLQGLIPRYQLEYRLKTKQGIYKWFFDQGSVTQRSPDGNPLKICGVVIDITEKKAAELQHLESERRFRQFAALLPQVVCELDSDFNLLYINDFGKNLFGIDTIKGQNLFDYIDANTKQNVLDSFYNLVYAPGTKDPGLELKIRNKDGNLVTIFAYANFDIENDKVNRIRAIGIDLTERINLENHLSALNEELNGQKNQLENFNKILEVRVQEEVEKNRVKDQLMSLQARHAAMGEMVSHIAHQWKQPLNTLNLIVYDIHDAYRYNELSEEYLESSVNSAKKVVDHMAQTIDDFKNFFKPLKEKEIFDIKIQIENALYFIMASVELEGIQIENNIKDSFKIKGYPNEFSQVVINIVNNAREAILESNIEKPVIKIESEIDDAHGYIRFINNGNPIPESILPRIFDPYFSTKDNNQGTGIGLYLVKTIVTQNLDGEIWAKNTNMGVIFEIVLPLS